MSRISYGVHIWGYRVSSTTISCLQIVQNLSMRWISNSSRFSNNINFKTNTELLKEVNLLSIKQLIVYDNLILLWIVYNPDAPYRLKNWINMKNTTNARIETTAKCLSRKLYELYYKFNPDIRSLTKISQFKLKLRVWIKENVSQF